MILWAIIQKYDDEPVGDGVFSLSFPKALEYLDEISKSLKDPRSSAEIMTFQYIGKPDDFDGLVFKKKKPLKSKRKPKKK